jgi:Zn finger protein HypA/HybF involved in hydrogenase expression
MFALLSVIECPGCGESIPLGTMNLFDDPDLTVMQCPKCGLDIQVRHGKGEELVVESLKKH